MNGKDTKSLPEDIYLNWIIKEDNDCSLKFNPLPEDSKSKTWTLHYNTEELDEQMTFSLSLEADLAEENILKGLFVKVSVILQEGNGSLVGKSVRKLKCVDIKYVCLTALYMSSRGHDFDIPGEYWRVQCHFQFSDENNSPDLCFPVAENQSLLDLSSDLTSVFNEGTYSDVQILVEQDIFPAHKSILSARSLAFKKMFEILSPETVSITISDTDSKSYRNFLKYLYTGVIDDSKPEAILILYTLAHRYNVHCLQKVCRQTLASVITVHNASNILKCSSRYGDEELAKKAKNFLDEIVPDD